MTDALRSVTADVAAPVMWPFLVGLGQTVDERVILAPGFMVESGTSALLLHATGSIPTDDPAPAASTIWRRTVKNDHADEFSVIFRIVPARPEMVGAPGDGLLYAKKRPVYLTEGVVLEGSGTAVLGYYFDQVHAIAASAFRDFWEADDPFAPTEASQPLTAADPIPASLPVITTELPPIPYLLPGVAGKATPGSGKLSSGTGGMAEPTQGAVPGAPVPHLATMVPPGRPAHATSAEQTEAAVRRTPPPRRRRRQAVAAGVAAIAVLAAAIAGWLLHSPSGRSRGVTSPLLAWAAAQAPLPGNAATGTTQAASLSDVACPSADSCVAVGAYSVDKSENTVTKPLIETLSNGTWIASGNVPSANNAREWLSAVACPARGSCVAVGEYYTGQDHPIAATLSKDTWTVTSLPLPRNADRNTNATVRDVECPAQGTCIATGGYTDQNGDTEALIETLSGGSWTAMPAALPTAAVPTKAAGRTTAYLAGVACPAAGSCVAVGQYSERADAAVPFIERLSGGMWTPETLPLPTDAVTGAGQLADLDGISCLTPENCVAVGHYTNRSAQAEYLAETLSGGTWTAAALPLPADAAAAQEWNTQHGGTSLGGVACSASDSCTATGSYATGNGLIDGTIDTLSSGAWTAAKAPLPSGAATTKQDVDLSRVLCLAPGNCVAVGNVEMADGSGQALIETATGKHR